MKRGQQFNMGLVITLIIALLLLVWGISFVIKAKEKQEGATETFTDRVRNIGNTFYEMNFLIITENIYDLVERGYYG